MNFKRLWTMFMARNHEFFRDRAAFGWNFLFPFLLVGGFAIIFGSDRYSGFKIGVFPLPENSLQIETLKLPEGFKSQRSFEFVPFASDQEALDKLKHHKIDFLVRNDSPSHEYWVNETSQKGYIVEQLFNASLVGNEHQKTGDKKQIQGTEIRFLDWFFPGILAMNMMFSALYGVGYAVVRYRKNGVLKRLKATPLTAFEYLGAQMLSRNFLILFTLIVVWIGCDLLFSFQMMGTYLNLILVFFIGSLSLTALGLVLASRGTSEEFTSGVINFISWPMMFLSEVWFSLEGAPQWVKNASLAFPLTHLLTAVRAIMNDGAGLAQISSQLIVLVGMTTAFLLIASATFSWNK